MANKKITLKSLHLKPEDVFPIFSENPTVPKFSNAIGVGKWVGKRILDEAGIKIIGTPFTVKEIQEIKKFYEIGFKKGEGSLDDLAFKLKRPKTSISRIAKNLNLTEPKRELSKNYSKKISERTKKWHQINEHPKGMKGKTHSIEYKKKLSIKAKKWWKEATVEQKNESRKKSVTTWRENGNDKRSRGSWKAGWREIGGKKKYFRSRWEANYARYLQFLKEKDLIQDWEHEPQTFWFEKIKRGVRSYLPDFKVKKKDGDHYWVEVKGYMDDKSKTKIKRFRKYYSDEHLQIIDKEWFKKNSKKISGLCKEWE